MTNSKQEKIDKMHKVWTKSGVKVHLIRNEGSRVAACGAFQKAWITDGDPEAGLCKLCWDRV